LEAEQARVGQDLAQLDALLGRMTAALSTSPSDLHSSAAAGSGHADPLLLLRAPALLEEAVHITSAVGGHGLLALMMGACGGMVSFGFDARHGHGGW